MVRNLQLVQKVQNIELISENNIDVYPNLKRYWNVLDALEKNLFFDYEGLQSYTSHNIALAIAQQVTGDHVVDLFCGVGGNSIGFAKMGKMVEAVDFSVNKLAMAHLNAEKFNVNTNINFINMEVSDFLTTLRVADTIFLDPPWGGSKHRSLEKFYFRNFQLDVESILQRCLKLAKHTIIKLPFNFDVNELSRFNKSVKITRHYLPNYILKRPMMLTASLIS